jgi:hypothetical protein
VRRIAAGLRARSGKTWSVTRGRGSVYGWIYIKARGHDLSPAEQRELAALLGVPTVHHQGVMIPSGSRARDEYVARAEGRTRNPKRRNPIPRTIDKRSVRSVGRGSKRILVGCPKGQYRLRARARKCATGMRRLNPTPEQTAAQTVRRFQDRGAIAVHKKRMRRPPPLSTTAAELGKLVGVVYRSDKFDGKSRDYEHDFSKPLPSLVTDPLGKGLHVVGGRYKITSDGIVN